MRIPKIDKWAIQNRMPMFLYECGIGRGACCVNDMCNAHTLKTPQSCDYYIAIVPVRDN